MQFLQLRKNEGIATVTLGRGKVNAINEYVIDEMADCFGMLADDHEVKAVIITGAGKFFSFGFDIPEFLRYPKVDFVRYLTKFTDFYTFLFLYPKPVVAALNGHTIAGGCMIAIACDYRIMVSGKAKIALNEINFGSSLFAGSVEMMKLLLGQRKAEEAAYSGAMYAAEEAYQRGLIDRISTEEALESDARNVALMYASRDGVAFKSIKNLLRKSAAEDMRRRERDSIREFVDIWYSESTWKTLQEKTIYS
jgi:3,2-trans-enoyl-CoA isomerase